MAKSPNAVQAAPGRKASPAAPAVAAPLAAPKKRIGPVQFLREVRAEARKVTWTSWKETWITSVMVGIMVVATAFFFFGVDTLMNLAMTSILKLAIGE
jgi:preprotein translocase subunit SecE